MYLVLVLLFRYIHGSLSSTTHRRKAVQASSFHQCLTKSQFTEVCNEQLMSDPDGDKIASKNEFALFLTENHSSPTPDGNIRSGGRYSPNGAEPFYSLPFTMQLKFAEAVCAQLRDIALEDQGCQANMKKHNIKEENFGLLLLPSRDSGVSSALTVEQFCGTIHRSATKAGYTKECKESPPYPHSMSTMSSNLPSFRPSLPPSPMPPEVSFTKETTSSRLFHGPSDFPSGLPSISPSKSLSGYPSVLPSRRPSNDPSRYPSRRPSDKPSNKPSPSTSVNPSSDPSYQPSGYSSAHPSCSPTLTSLAHDSITRESQSSSSTVPYTHKQRPNPNIAISARPTAKPIDSTSLIRDSTISPTLVEMWNRKESKPPLQSQPSSTLSNTTLYAISSVASRPLTMPIQSKTTQSEEGKHFNTEEQKGTSTKTILFALCGLGVGVGAFLLVLFDIQRRRGRLSRRKETPSSKQANPSSRKVCSAEQKVFVAEGDGADGTTTNLNGRKDGAGDDYEQNYVFDASFLNNGTIEAADTLDELDLQVVDSDFSLDIEDNLRQSKQPRPATRQSKSRKHNAAASRRR